MRLDASSTVRGVRIATPAGLTAAMTLSAETVVGVHVSSSPCTSASCDTSSSTQCAAISSLNAEDADNIIRNCASAKQGSFVYAVFYALPESPFNAAALDAFSFEVYSYTNLGVSWDTQSNSFVNTDLLPTYQNSKSFWGVRRFSQGTFFSCLTSSSEKISTLTTANLPACFSKCESTQNCRSVEWNPNTRSCILMKDFDDDTKCTESVDGSIGFKLWLDTAAVVKNGAGMQLSPGVLRRTFLKRFSPFSNFLPHSLSHSFALVRQPEKHMRLQEVWRQHHQRVELRPQRGSPTHRKGICKVAEDCHLWFGGCDAAH